MADLIGRDIDRYHIIEQLGQGGMAVVYKAYDTRLERDVAVKVIRRNAFSPDVLERVLKRFDREAKSLAKLTHPNIVSIIDYGEYDGSPYLVMPYLMGGTLKQALGQPMAWQQAFALLFPVADALAYAHQKGIVHRDVKPGNILVTEGGAPMLTDFGIARLLESEESQTLTATGVGVGTPEYMSPEQGMGREVDGRSDIYSLGVVLYELITGLKPYTADTPMAVLLKQSTEPLPRPGTFIKDLPEEVEKVIYKALAKNPEDRFQSMGEFAAALGKLEWIERKKQPTPPVSRHITQSIPESSATMDQISLDEVSYKSELPPLKSKGQGSKKRIPIGKMIGFALFGIAVIVILIGVLDGWFVPTSYLSIGSTMVSEKDGMTMVYVPEGEFLMGSDEEDGYPDTRPVHTVYLDAYWIDQTEVTNAMYQKCVIDGVCSKPENEASTTRSDYYSSKIFYNYPVVNLTWVQAQTYCEWTEKRLPTEAEWEKAARGTDGRLYPWGNEEDFYFQKSFSGSIHNDTYMVGSYPAGASPYGALNMAGNVWEWVADWYQVDYYSVSSSNNPTGPVFSIYHILRGGNWDMSGLDLQVVNRCGLNHPVDGCIIEENTIGFRCAMDAD